MDPLTYSHPVRDLQVVETHISWVVLTGDFVYKLKKPVNLGFIDFSSPQQRHRSCEDEVRLNLRTAPELYLGVVPLELVDGAFRFGKEDEPAGQVVEYAVCMRQFPPGDRLDNVAARGELSRGLLRQLAAEVARSHGSPSQELHAIAKTYPERLGNVFRCNSLLLPDTPVERSLRLRWSQALNGCRDLLALRSRAGRVRECHGDLHLGNICLWKGKPTLFDCIEFSEDLRVIDVLSDTAFLFMDLIDSGLAADAHFFLNSYLEATGDYCGLEAWPIFVAYRAHVRAMVAHLSAQPARRDRYLSLSSEVLEPPSKGIVLTAGLPGSGKSTEALRIACEEGGVRIRSDVERKRLHASHPDAALYSGEMSRRTYESLLSQARAACLGGLVAVLDATFHRREDRARAIRLAVDLRVPVRIVFLTASLNVLESRVRSRKAVGGDPSDADERVLHDLAAQWEPFLPEEARW